MGKYYKGELPTEFNGITMEEADRLASEFLQNEPCNRMWDAIRALRDFYEDIKTFSVKIKTPHGRLIDEDALCYEVVKKGGVDFIYAATSCIKDTPTVIEADYND